MLVLCTHNDLIKSTTNKQYNSYSYALKLAYINDENTKILYRNDIETRRNELLNQGIQVPSKRVLESDLKYLSKLGYINILNTPNGICYIIKENIGGEHFTKISIYRWEKLITHKNLLRLYMVFTNKCTSNDFTLLTRKYLCESMDINATKTNKSYIGDMIESLCRLGVLIKEQRHENIVLDDGVTFKNVTHNYYRLSTDKELKEKI